MSEFGGLPTTIETLIIIALVISPGYVFTQIARRSIAHIEEPTDLRFLLTIITAGVAIQALAFPLYTRFLLGYYVQGTILEHQTEAFLWLVTVCFVAPFVLGALAGRAVSWGWVEKLLDMVGLGYIDRMPSAWDYVILQKRSRYVRVHLKDGKGMIGGIYHKDSLASTDPDRPDLYLEQAWQLDSTGAFEKVLPGTSGVWISQHAMEYVYFYEGEDEPYVEPPDSDAGSKTTSRGSRHRKTRGPARRTPEALPAASGAGNRQRAEGQQVARPAEADED